MTGDPQPCAGGIWWSSVPQAAWRSLADGSPFFLLSLCRSLPGGTQGMVEVIAENYHNIWAKKKKLELESKGMPASQHPPEGELGQVCPHKSHTGCPLPLY